jgi:hypothetical protein
MDIVQNEQHSTANRNLSKTKLSHRKGSPQPDVKPPVLDLIA